MGRSGADALAVGFAPEQLPREAGQSGGASGCGSDTPRGSSAAAAYAPPPVPGWVNEGLERGLLDCWSRFHLRQFIKGQPLSHKDSLRELAYLAAVKQVALDTVVEDRQVTDHERQALAHLAHALQVPQGRARAYGQAAALASAP